MAETLNTHQEENPDANQEHDKAMLEKAEQLESNSNRPEWLPEKFKSAEELVASYQELEKKLGQPKQEAEETITEEQRETIQEQENEVAQVMDKAGLDFNVFQKEYEENGELSNEAYDALSKAGFPKTLVDTWIQGQEALQGCLLYTSPSPRDPKTSRMPSSA